MKSFNEYYALREQGEEMMGQDQNQNHETLSDDKLISVMKVIARKHKKDIEDFVNHMAEQDPEVKHAMTTPDQDSPIHQDPNAEKDEVMPHKADGSSGMGEEDGDM